MRRSRSGGVRRHLRRHSLGHDGRSLNRRNGRGNFDRHGGFDDACDGGRRGLDVVVNRRCSRCRHFDRNGGGSDYLDRGGGIVHGSFAGCSGLLLSLGGRLLRLDVALESFTFRLTAHAISLGVLDA